jgi:hypothetical protein
MNVKALKEKGMGMDVICCRSNDDEAEKAFRLRYSVYGAEIGVHDVAIDHEKGIYIDKADKAARIYLAVKDGDAVATCRSVYDRDYDFRRELSPAVFDMLGLDNFLKSHSGSLAISTKFAISQTHRGSLAAHLVTAKMFDDIIEDGIHFVFSWCAPYLFSFYSQLGFHMYSHAISDENGLWTPIVLATRDWRHLQEVRSPLFKQLEKKGLCEGTHSSVEWFYANYGHTLEAFVERYDEHVLDTIFSHGAGEDLGKDLQNISIFKSMTAEDVNKIVGMSSIMHFSAGDEIMRTGQIQDEMFIIVEGHVEAYLETSPARSIRFGPGQVFGELAMLTRSKRVVNCRALADSRLAFLTRQGLAKLMKVEPELSVRLLYNLSQFLSLTLLKTINDLKKVP